MYSFCHFAISGLTILKCGSCDVVEVWYAQLAHSVFFLCNFDEGSSNNIGILKYVAGMTLVLLLVSGRRLLCPF